ncbi:MAG: cyclohydrolase, partial [Acidobacteria bacterium]|nr:cyclohydrolase [Acidobacteriota bacterium]
MAKSKVSGSDGVGGLTDGNPVSMMLVMNDSGVNPTSSLPTRNGRRLASSAVVRPILVRAERAAASQVAPRFDAARIERAVREILAAIGEDPEREGLRDT